MQRFLSFLIFWLVANHTFATHIMGGYIQARRVSQTSVTYEFSIKLFMDEVGGRAASEQSTTIDFCLGDGSPVITIPRTDRQNVNAALTINTYQTTYTYKSADTRTVSVRAINRSSDTRNLPTFAVEKAFYLESTVAMNAVNTTPAFPIPANQFQGTVNQPVIMALGTSDTEGDSLLYSVSRIREGDCGIVSAAQNGYVFPNDVSQQGIYKIDSRKGELVWNAPTQQGRYVVVVKVEEWRKNQRISVSYLDIIVQVTEQKNTPSIVIPAYEPVVERDLILGLADFVGDSDFSIRAFPVPVQGQLTLRLTGSQSITAKVQVFNAGGQVVRELDLQTPLPEYELLLDTSQWGAGTYLIRTYTLGKAYTSKVVK